jgi:hypothetical protein
MPNNSLLHTQYLRAPYSLISRTFQCLCDLHFYSSSIKFRRLSCLRSYATAIQNAISGRRWHPKAFLLLLTRRWNSVVASKCSLKYTTKFQEFDDAHNSIFRLQTRIIKLMKYRKGYVLANMQKRCNEHTALQRTFPKTARWSWNISTGLLSRTACLNNNDRIKIYKCCA